MNPYIKTNFVDDGSIYVDAAFLNDLQDYLISIGKVAAEPCSYTAGSSSSANYVISVPGRSAAPAPSEMPIWLLFIPTVTNAVGATITPSWGDTAYPIYDKSTNAQVQAGIIKLNQPCLAFFDGTKFWVDGNGQCLQYAPAGSTAGGFFDTVASLPDTSYTATLRWRGDMYARKFFGAVFNPSAADFAEGYPIRGEFEPGELMCVTTDGYFERNAQEGNTHCIGIVSDEFGIFLGSEFGSVPIACAGRVHAKVDGRCCAGDFLIASEIDGCLKPCDLSVAPRGGVYAMALVPKETNGIDRILVQIKGA